MAPGGSVSSMISSATVLLGAAMIPLNEDIDRSNETVSYSRSSLQRPSNITFKAASASIRSQYADREREGGPDLRNETCSHEIISLWMSAAKIHFGILG